MATASAIKQRGAVVMLLLGVLGSVGAFWWVQHDATHQRARLANSHSDRVVHELQQAKSALISYALSYADNYRPRGAGVGHLPCPDLDPVDDGNPHNDGPNPPCGTLDRQLGRLPRQTFTFGAPLQTGAGRVARKRLSFHAHRSNMDQQPWYAVSATFVNNPVATRVNPDTVGMLQVDRQEDIVAVIIAPGPALAEQAGARPGDQVKDYLEAANADLDTVFTRINSASANDQLVSISRQELMPLLERRILGFVKDWIAEFQDRHCPQTQHCFPFAGEGYTCVLNRYSGALPFLPGACDSALSHSGQLDGVALTAHWFVRNQWHRYVRYELAPECSGGTIDCQINLQIGSDRESGQSLVMITPIESEH